MYWKRHHIKDSLKPRWKGPHRVLLTNSHAAKFKGIDSWFHFSHLKGAPAPDWTIERATDLKLTFFISIIFYFKLRHVSDRGKELYMHDIKSRGITNFRSF